MISAIKRLTNNELITALREKSVDERRTTLEVIELLQEVDQRSLHLQIGYGSLLEFCIKELKYSESAAYRRISAMRVTRDIPHIKKSIETGSLNLASITQAQTFFQREMKYQAKIYSKEEKLEVLAELENKSKREAEKILLKKSPMLPQPEYVRAITETQIKVTLNLEDDLVKKLNLLKYTYSHTNPNPSYAELIELMASDLLWRKNISTKNPRKTYENNLQHEATPPVETSDVLSNSHKISRYISASLRNYIFKRDNGCCSYEDPITRRKCSSQFQLEIDHIKPFSYGGANEPNNLRLVCRNHNQYYWKFRHSGPPNR